MDSERVVEVFPEGQLTTQKLIEHDSYGPDVGRKRVSLACHHLGCHVVWSSNNGEGSESVSLFELLGSPHVYKFQIPVILHHNVLWLEVPIDDGL